MRKMKKHLEVGFTLLAALAVAAFGGTNQGHTHSMPYGPDFGEGYKLQETNFTYSQELPSLVSTDYANFVLHAFDKEGRHWVCGRLRNGHWRGFRKIGVAGETLSFRKAFVLDESEQSGHVLVLFDYYSGVGTGDSDLYAQVWATSNEDTKNSRFALLARRCALLHFCVRRTDL